MKIAIVCPNDLSKIGGVQNVVFETSSRLKKLGHTIKIISIKPRKPVKRVQIDFFGSGIPVRTNGTSTEISFENLEESERLNKYLRDENFDLVCVHHPQAPMLSLEVLFYSKAMNIGWFHATLTKSDKPVFNLIEKGLSQWLKKRMAGYIAVSPSVYKEWNYIFNDKKGIILPVGVDINRFKFASKINLGAQFNILFVGRLDERKGVLDAIKMMPTILNSLAAKLYIIGDGDQRAEAESLVEDLGIQKHVTFEGKIKDANLPKYYKSADLYCAPSLGGESFGIVLIEAMASGTPIVGYANDGYKFPMKGNPWKGSLVKTGAYEKLAISILEIANNNRLRKRVIDWQNERVKAFDWDIVVENFLKFVKSLSS